MTRLFILEIIIQMQLQISILSRQTPRQMHRNRQANYDYGIVNSQSPQIYYYSTERDAAIHYTTQPKKTENP